MSIASGMGSARVSRASCADGSARQETTVWRDSLVVVAVTVLAALLCARFNLSEHIHRWTAPWEWLQLDELPGVLLVLAAALAWLAVRRYREAARELRYRRAAETRLGAALAENRRLAQQYVELQENERKTLARELHDELGQYLNVIKLDAVGIRDARTAGQEPAHERAGAIVENCSRIHAALAGLIRQLRPVGLDELGLAAALEHCIETWRPRIPQTQLELLATGDLEALPEGVALTVYRLVQEAVTNAAKHASAGHLTVQIERRARRTADDAIHVAITDDGAGAAPGLSTRGLGLIGMRERVAALDGELEVATSPDLGFRVTARIPVHVP
ncbi:MAG: ATP-binding protein [Steroidobacteraceae bacterium]